MSQSQVFWRRKRRSYSFRCAAIFPNVISRQDLCRSGISFFFPVLFLSFKKIKASEGFDLVPLLNFARLSLNATSAAHKSDLISAISLDPKPFFSPQGNKSFLFFISVLT